MIEEIVSAYSPTPQVISPREASEQLKHDQPPHPLDVVRRALEEACLLHGCRLEATVYDADHAVAKRTNRKPVLLIASDLPLYLNQGTLPPGVEDEVAAKFMPRLAEVYGVKSWVEFKKMTAVRTRPAMENIRIKHRLAQAQ
jgi:hypothetical protein